MRERTAGDRIRVAIAGTIYAKRALVRRFLEDDGFAVVAEANDRDELFSALRSQEPDAVVLDDDIADWDIEDIRRASPDAKIVVFTSGSPGGPGVPAGADGYLQKGVGLGTLTLLLRELLAEPVVPIVLPAPPVRVPNGAAHERRVVIRLAALVAALVLIAAGALALVGQAPTGEERTLPTIQPTPPPERTQTALDQAIADLRDLQAALRDGRYAQASALAQALLLDRQAALAAGFSVTELDRAIGSTLQPLMALLGPGIVSTLQSILGDLLPAIPQPPPTTGGGIVLPGTGGGGGTVGTGGGTPPPGGGTGEGGGGGGGGNGGGGEPGDGEGGQGGGSFTGNGNHNGWRNKPPKGGWKGENPKRQGPKEDGGEQGKEKGPKSSA
jgi:CheY-like chemotaxis protein